LRFSLRCPTRAQEKAQPHTHRQQQVDQPKSQEATVEHAGQKTLLECGVESRDPGEKVVEDPGPMTKRIWHERDASSSTGQQPGVKSVLPKSQGNGRRDPPRDR